MKKLMRGLLVTTTGAALLLTLPLLAPLAAAPANKSITIAPPSGAPMSFADLVERVSPAVVSISVTDNIEDEAPDADGDEEDMEELSRRLERFFGPNSPFSEFPFGRRQFRMPNNQQPRFGAGSGFFISSDGLLVTNHHVIDGADEITVRLDNGDEYEADILGTDEQTDLALLKIDGGSKKFTYVTMSEAADSRVGDWVVAIGSPFRLGGTATAGIISANGRQNIGGPYTDFIQIDAPINPGNSGGPLFDLRGNVIGVNTAIFSRSGGNIGIGFAIPSELAVDIIEDLKDSGKVERGWLGVVIAPVDDDQAMALGFDEAKGAIVNSVNDGSPAKKAGFRAGDVIISMNGEEIEDNIELTRLVGRLKPNSNAIFKVVREDGKRKTLRVKIAKRPSQSELARLARGEARSNSGDEDGGRGDARPEEKELLGMELRRPDEDERETFDLASDDAGVVITDIERTSEAAEKGLRRGMLVQKINGRSVHSLDNLEAEIAAARRSGRKAVMLLVLDRAGNKRYIGLPIG